MKEFKSKFTAVSVVVSRDSRGYGYDVMTVQFSHITPSGASLPCQPGSTVLQLSPDSKTYRQICEDIRERRIFEFTLTRTEEAL
jgi:hypothetical protein